MVMSFVLSMLSGLLEPGQPQQGIRVAGDAQHHLGHHAAQALEIRVEAALHVERDLGQQTVGTIDQRQCRDDFFFECHRRLEVGEPGKRVGGPRAVQPRPESDIAPAALFTRDQRLPHRPSCVIGGLRLAQGREPALPDGIGIHMHQGLHRRCLGNLPGRRGAFPHRAQGAQQTKKINRSVMCECN